MVGLEVDSLALLVHVFVIFFILLSYCSSKNEE